MQRLLLWMMLYWAPAGALAQTKTFSGSIIDSASGLPVEGAVVHWLPLQQWTVTNEAGNFSFPSKLVHGQLKVFSLGHKTQFVSLEDFAIAGNRILLPPAPIQLSSITVSAIASQPYRTIGKIDIKLRGINNAQEVLRMVPGLFIGQHAGGGKAEQIFLRGFDLDHGTDISIGVDGMPVNMVSHAHGQGYADLHFLIPELIEHVNFKKGAYYAEKGNFTTTGFVDFKTFNTLAANSVKTEAGMFQTLRTVGMFNLLSQKARAKGQSVYAATEYMYSRGFFDNPQGFRRSNVFAKYNGRLGSKQQLTVSASNFYSKWDASGQIPGRAVAAGFIGFFGAIDPNEGGATGRTNLNAILTTSLNGGLLKNQFFYSRYQFELYSNFTFFKEDPVNGDQIRQKEKRDLFGYNGSYHKTIYAGRTAIQSEAGVQVRLDRTKNSELSRTKNKTELLSALSLGGIAESNLAVYISETFHLTPRFSMNTGLRYDYFVNRYTNRLAGNSTAATSAGIVSPKLNFYYQLTDKAQLYLTNGRGFHSNDTRVAVPQKGLDVLPATYGSDLGTVLKPSKQVLVNAALWYLWMNQEFVYVGDEGVVEPSGSSRRYGADLSVRYQPLPWLYADFDLNYAHGRAADAPAGANFLPLAPGLTAIGGITLKTKRGFNASLRSRYLGNRPANENNSVTARGYFINDVFVNYLRARYELGLSIQNLMNVQWKETQFETESRLQNETAPVSEIHFTPGTPFFAKLSFTLLF